MSAEKSRQSTDDKAPVAVQDASDDYMTVNIGASIGIAISPTQGTTPESSVTTPDAAMYTAKRGKSGFCVAPTNPDAT